MPENEFERKIQERMEELRLHPSDSVWQKVEEEIRDKKKRRVVFFFILLAGLGLLGYLGYSYLHTDQRPEIAAQNTKQPVQSNNTTTTDPVTSNNNKTSPVINEPSGKEKKAIVREEVVAPQTTPIDKGNNPQEIKKEKETIAREKFVTADPTAVAAKQINSEKERSLTGNKKQRQAPSTVNSTNDIPAAVAEEKNANVTKENNEVVKDKMPENKLQADNKPVIITDPSAKNIAEENKSVKDSITNATASVSDIKQTPTDSLLQEAAPVISQQKKKTTKFKIGVDFSAGWVSRKMNVGSFEKSNQTNDISGNVSAPSGPTGPIYGGTGTVVLPPSSVKAGQGFKAGVATQLELSKRSRLISALRYVYMSEKIKISSSTLASSGNFYLSNGANFAYRSLQQKTYTNKYHFIELPVLFETRLTNGKKTSLSWNGGLSASYLISTNALTYDTLAGGIYYKDMAAFNRFHVNLQTGFSVAFGNQKKVQWSLGPELSLDLRKLMKQDAFDKNRYLMYGGITGRVFFGGPKK